jgi:hypothetical protein
MVATARTVADKGTGIDLLSRSGSLLRMARR